MDSRNTVRLAVADDLTAVDKAVTWAAESAAAAGLGEAASFGLRVCLEEVLANLVRHGRASDGAKNIEVELRVENREAVLEVSDSCSTYDPIRESPPPLASADDMRVGGQGLRLMRAFARELAYATVGGRNTLTLRIGAPAVGIGNTP